MQLIEPTAPVDEAKRDSHKSPICPVPTALQVCPALAEGHPESLFTFLKQYPLIWVPPAPLQSNGDLQSFELLEPLFEVCPDGHAVADELH